LVRNVVGRYFDDLHPNGDYYCEIDDVRRGRFRPEIRSPGTSRQPKSGGWWRRLLRGTEGR
jgi:hypothetical protein